MISNLSKYREALALAQSVKMVLQDPPWLKDVKVRLQDGGYCLVVLVRDNDPAIRQFLPSVVNGLSVLVAER